jgi:hypothetical protein
VELGFEIPGFLSPESASSNAPFARLEMLTAEGLSEQIAKIHTRRTLIVCIMSLNKGERTPRHRPLLREISLAATVL